MKDYDSIDYKQERKVYIGVSKSFLDAEYYKRIKNQSCYIIIKIIGLNQETKYAILYYNLSSTLGTNKPTLLSDKEYCDRIKSYVSPIIPEIHTSISSIIYSGKVDIT